MEDPNAETIPTATSRNGNSGMASPVSANSHVGNQTSPLQSLSNSRQQAEISQAPTSPASLQMAEPTDTRRPTASGSTPSHPAAKSQSRPPKRPLWKRKISLFKRSHRDQTSAEPVPREWRDNWLHPGRLAVVFLATLSIIAAIATCCVISLSKNGLVQVSDSTITIANYQVGPALAWTTLPVLLITLYGMAFGAVVAACSDRQPYIELWAQDQDIGATLNQSILLDYRAHSKLTQPWIAIRNKHLLLVFAITFTSIVNILLTSLTAYLFDAAVVDTNVPRAVTQNTTFNPAGFTYLTDLVPIFDIVSSSLVYDGTPPAWTTFSYSLLNFSNPATPKGNIGSSNFSLETMAYSANLDCSVLDESEYNLTYGSLGWQFSGLDRGCQLTKDLLIGGLGSQNFTYYMQSFANIDCDIDAGQSCLVVLAAANFNQSLTVLTNITAISCTTAYFNTSGTLDVKLDLTSSATPAIQNFTAGSTTQMTDPRPEFWKDFESLLHEASINDGTATTSATDFGRSILEYTEVIDPQAYLSPDTLRNSTMSIFTAVYATMSRIFLVQPTVAVSVTGTLSISSTRLFVVTPISYTIIGILCAVGLITIWICIYVRKHKSILYEEPKVLLGSATLLCNSDLGPKVIEMRTHVNNGKIVEAFEQGKYLKYINDKGWKIEKGDSPQESRIVMTSRARKPEWHFP